MDLFADSDEDSEDDSDRNIALCNIAFIELMICKPFVKNTVTEESHVFHRRIVLVGEDEVTSLLKEKLDRTQFKNVKILTAAESDAADLRVGEAEKFDVVVNLNLIDNSTGEMNDTLSCENLLISGGTFMTVCPSSYFDLLFPKVKWNTAKASRKPFASPHFDGDQNGFEFVVIQKRGFLINTLGAIYWTGTESDRNGSVISSQKKNNKSSIISDKKKKNNENSNDKALETEYSNLEEVTVALSVEERLSGIFSDISHRKSLDALQIHGLCIFPGIFSTNMVMEWGDAAVSDMKEALFTLRKRGIDLLHPGEGGPRIENFHELSMREALRCDLRNGRHLKALSQRNFDNSVVPVTMPRGVSNHVETDKNNGNIETEIPVSSADAKFSTRNNIRRHPALLSVLQQTLNPPPPDPRDQMGNWGLWNFEGRGPEFGPPDFSIGEVGAVMSLPGCADQTIHADTPHLYVHTQLPGHYINLFVPAVLEGDSSAGIEVGQTAFVVGSHQLRVSAHVMNEEGGQEVLEERLVRPHLRAGDALLFDCRILHFGLANQHPRSTHNKKDKCEDKNVNSDLSGEENNAEDTNNATILNSEGNCCDGNGDCSDGWRPLLYVNYHQKFFQDPKNWNDKEKLFT